MSKTGSLLICLLFGVTCFAQVDSQLAQYLQEVLDNQVSGANHGVSAYVIMPNGDTWSGQAGEDGAGNPVEINTVFHGASSTKMHVATCVMLMVEDGLLNLDAAWTDYLTLNVSFDPNITVRQLLNHTAGLADYLEVSGAGNYAIDDPGYQFTGQEILEDIVSQAPDFLAGTDFNYSNTNYVLLGLIIEEVSGNSLYQELRERIWTPLNLDHTYGGGFEEYSEAQAGVWWNFGFGTNNYSDISPVAMLSFGYACGGIVSTPANQAAFINALMQEELLSETSLEEMMEFVPESFGAWSAGYGLGLHHAIDTDSDEVLGHDGYYTNMSSTFYSTYYGFTITTAINTQSTWYGVFAPIYDALIIYFETAVEEVQPLDILFFPNPSQGNFEIQGFGSEVTHIEVYNGQGQLVKVQKYAGEKSLDLSELLPGRYQVFLVAKEKITGSQLLLIE